MPFPRWLSAALPIALVCLSTVAAAAPTQKEKAEARALVTEAKKALKEKRFGDAEGPLRRADELDPSPQTKLDLAQALIENKKLMEGTRVLHTVAGGTETNTPAGKKAVEAAKKLLADAEPRIPWLGVSIVGPSAGKAKVKIDGTEVDAAAGEVPLDPGVHKVVVSASGYTSEEKKVELLEGEHESVKLVLKKTEEADDGGGSASSSGIGGKWPAFIGFGVGAVGLGLGTAFGVVALGQADDAKAQCKGTVCPPGAQDEIDASKTSGTISTVGFIAGGVGVAAGVVLLIVLPGKKASARAPSVLPLIGAGQVGVMGTF